ncbi:hypothetical protein FRX31_011299 [Thalictrum thalictroides]|uniref:RNase H type-1 domain-containing protein n=1 Tax=Thalictrum thalictroides TaxID=46969 RepID=A0A7J6WRM2_THATH|nr:hypothetical protein FRX31_011299 [Thalictrum thalictroides]
MGFKKLCIGTDSLQAVRIIMRKAAPAWLVRGITTEIERMLLLDYIEWDIQHSFRESNQVADFLANLGTSMQRNLTFFKILY